MTMPSERTRALRWAGEFLRELQASDKFDPDLKRQIQVILRHYPSTAEIHGEAAYPSGGGPDWVSAWLAPED